ncbi:hypothetical protein GGI19_006868 [Coemansia pectinata]|uniref:Uncharacterized protein n=1 Tax=Coemansia pectinata TaxID=1052879 RepID=A0A9W8GQV6_9FUNG|nr:hypothetical protein GGI19_006868 [Coemansia pectinata]
MQHSIFRRALIPGIRCLATNHSANNIAQLGRILYQRRSASNRANIESENDSSYEETAKGQLRDYEKWRKHFTWKRERVVQILREYALWSALGLLAYYNLTKRQEAEEYDASTFVLIDSIEEKISIRDPLNPLLAGSTREVLAPSDDAINSSGQSKQVLSPTRGNNESPVFF